VVLAWAITGILDPKPAPNGLLDPTAAPVLIPGVHLLAAKPAPYGLAALTGGIAVGPGSLGSLAPTKIRVL
jgi:hypothetical protein